MLGKRHQHSLWEEMLGGICDGQPREWLVFSKPVGNRVGCVVGLGERALGRKGLEGQCAGLVGVFRV